MSSLAQLMAKQDNLKRSAEAITPHGGANVNHPGIQKQRFEEIKVPIYQCLASTFYEIWKKHSDKYKDNSNQHNINNSKDNEQLEIEIRLGAIVLNNYRYKSQITEKLAIVINDQHRKTFGSNLIFESGIDETHAEYLQSKVLTSEDFEVTELVSVLLCCVFLLKRVCICSVVLLFILMFVLVFIIYVSVYSSLSFAC